MIKIIDHAYAKMAGGTRQHVTIDASIVTVDEREKSGVKQLGSEKRNHVVQVHYT
jgi:hypothetical protein